MTVSFLDESIQVSLYVILKHFVLIGCFGAKNYLHNLQMKTLNILQNKDLIFENVVLKFEIISAIHYLRKG